jgi:hypothetical protein
MVRPGGVSHHSQLKGDIRVHFAELGYVAQSGELPVSLKGVLLRNLSVIATPDNF